MNTASPLQLIVRLRAIERELAGTDDMSTINTLVAERACILVGAGKPPDVLAGCYEPEQWAAMYAAAHAGTDQVGIYEWFAKYADQVAAHVGPIAHAEGQRAGRADVSRLVDMNRMLLAMMRDRRMTDPVIRDDSNPDAPPIKASEHIRRLLAGLGVDVA